MRGLKENELGPCASCGKPHRTPVFYRVRLETCGIDAKAAERRAGLGLMIGDTLAAVMGPDEDLAKVIDETTRIVCLDCATNLPLLAAMMGDG